MVSDVREIQRWFEEGKQKRATHLIVVRDTFDNEDYPVFVMPHENAKLKAALYQKAEMQKVMEIYSYAKTWDEQKEGRAWNL